jgi:hypothetical protein
MNLTVKRYSRFLGVCIGVSITLCAADYSLPAVSWLGGAGDNDRAVGIAYQKSGTLVIAANIGDARPGHTILPRQKEPTDED